MVKRLPHFGLGFFDQGLSSLSNVLILVSVARVSETSSFGSLSLTYALFAFGLAIQRVALGMSMSLSVGTGVPPPLMLAFGWGVLLTAFGCLVLTQVGGELSWAHLLLLSVCLVAYPQDVLRFTAVSAQRAGIATLSDGIWVTFAVVGLFLTIRSATTSILTIVLLWGVGAFLALVAMLVMLRPSAWGDRRWLEHHGKGLKTVLPDSFLSAAAPLIVATWLAGTMGLADVAAVRGAGTLLGPVSLLVSAVPLVFLPEIARLRGRQRARVATLQSVMMGSLVMTWGSVWLVVPNRLGQEILGESWGAASGVVFFVTLEMALLAMGSGAVGILRTHRRTGWLLGVRLTYFVALCIVLAVLVPSGELRQVLIGMIVVSLGYLTGVVAFARRALRVESRVVLSPGS